MGKIEAIVTTAEGETIRFAGAVAQFVVAHPRLSAWLFFLAGCAVGDAVLSRLL